jgi:hypothetical protein
VSRGTLTSAALTAALALPPMPRAACRGRAPLHDLDVAGESDADRAQRHEAAAWTCHACPALAHCRALLPTLPKGTTGVYAGLLLDGRRPLPPTGTNGE